MAEPALLPKGVVEPCWFFPSPRSTAAAEQRVEAFLQSLDEQERRLVILVYGLRLELGSVARALQLDPSIVSWRVGHALQRGANGDDPAELEHGLVALLSRRGAAGSRAEELVAQFPADVRERLASQGRVDPARAGSGSAGLGIGSLVLILLAVAGFIVYGTIRDVNPLWRGKMLVRQGKFDEARRTLLEAGNLQEARAWLAITWLAEGHFDKALEVIHEPGVAQYFGDFQPVQPPLQAVEGDPASGALLPRGVTSDAHPRWVFRAGPAGKLRFEAEPLGRGQAGGFSRSVEVTGTSGPRPFAELEHPADWPGLAGMSVTWTAPGEDAGSASFTVLSNEERVELLDHARRQLISDIPVAARTFLKAHYFVKNKLYTQAGGLFAGLSRQFPAEEHPRQMLAEIGAALAVDPSVFLR